jgi:hypothetical protein
MFAVAAPFAKGVGNRWGTRNEKKPRPNIPSSTNKVNKVKKIGEQSPIQLLAEGEYAKGMVDYELKERQLESQSITNRIKTEKSAYTAPKIIAFRLKTLEEINGMSETDLKTLLKTHDFKKPTPLLNRLKKGLLRGLTLRTATNSKNELVALAKNKYFDELVEEERWQLNREAEAIAVGRLTPEEKALYEEEKDWKMHKDDGGYVRVKASQGISPYVWKSKVDNEAEIGEFLGSLGGRRKLTRRVRR